MSKKTWKKDIEVEQPKSEKQKSGMTGQCHDGNHKNCKGYGGVDKNHLGRNTRYTCNCPCHKEGK